MTRSRILVIEDSAELRRLMVLALELAGYDVSEAEDGATGLERASTLVPDLIVLDLMLPILSGLQVLSEMQRRHVTAQISVLVTTGTIASERHMKELGAAGLLRKPINGPDLVEKVTALLATRQRSAESHSGAGRH